MKETICDKQGYWRKRRTEVSKKPGTDELVNILKNTHLYFDEPGKAIAIIARLRAADKLLDIAKRARFIISVYCKEHIDEYDKAIADCEVKEKK